MLIESLFIVGKKRTITLCLLGEWIYPIMLMYSHETEYYSIVKQEWTIYAETNVDESQIHYHKKETNMV